MRADTGSVPASSGPGNGFLTRRPDVALVYARGFSSPSESSTWYRDDIMPFRWSSVVSLRDVTTVCTTCALFCRRYVGGAESISSGVVVVCITGSRANDGCIGGGGVGDGGIGDGGVGSVCGVGGGRLFGSGTYIDL